MTADAHDRYLQQLLRIRDDLQGYCLVLMHNWSDADELFQRTATVLWECFADWDPQRSFALWARGIARNQALKHYRERRRLVQLDAPALDAVDVAFAAQEIPAEPEGDPDLEALRACLGELSPSARRLLAWRYGDNRPIASIAKKLGRSVAAITKQLSRLRVALQGCITKRLQAEGVA